LLLNVIVKTNSRTNTIQIVNGIYNVSVKSKPQDGKANEDLIEVLSEYFSVAKSKVVIKRGLTTQHKSVEILK